MLINKYSFIDIGVDDDVAYSYVTKLSRQWPTITKMIDKEYTIRYKKVKGRVTMVHFDLDYAIGIAKEKIAKAYKLTHLKEWENMLIAMLKIKGLQN
jgi:hypothetical protein